MVDIATASADDLRTLCKKQATQLEECRTKLTAQAGSLKAMADAAAEGEQKLEIWKGRAKGRIAQLEEELAAAKAAGGSGSGDATAAALQKELDDMSQKHAEEAQKVEIWKTRVREKIAGLEAQLQAAKEAGGGDGDADAAKAAAAEAEATLATEREKFAGMKEKIRAKLAGLEEELQAEKDKATAAAGALAEATALRAQVAALEGSATTLTAELDTARARADALETAGRDGAAEVDALKASLVDARAAADAAKADAATQVAEVQAELAAAKEASRERVAALEDALRAQQAEAVGVSASATDDESALAAMQRSLADERARSAEAREALGRAEEAAETVKASLTEQIAAAEERAAAAEAKARLAEVEARGGSEEAAELQAKIDAVTGERDRALADATERQAELEKLKAAANAGGEGTANSQQTVQDLEGKLRAANRTITDLNQKVEDLEFSSDMNGGGKDLLEQDLQDAKAKCAALKTDADAAKAKLAKAEADLAEGAKERAELAQKFQLFKQKAKEMHTTTQVEGEERHRAAAEGFENYKEKAIESLKKKTNEIAGLKEALAAAEARAADLSTQNSSLALQCDEREADVCELRGVAEGYREEMAMFEAKLHNAVEEASAGLAAQQQQEVAELHAMYESRMNDAHAMHSVDLSDKVQQQQELLSQVRKELKLHKEMTARATDEKEREVARLNVTITELRGQIEALQAGGAAAAAAPHRSSHADPSPSPSQSGGRSPISGRPQDDFGGSSMGGMGAFAGGPKTDVMSMSGSGHADISRDMMFIAQQQANRDWEINKLQAECDRLTKKVQDLQEQRDRNMRELTATSHEKKQLKASETRANVSMDYLKNVLVQFISNSRNKSVQAGLLPVIATMMEMTPGEKMQLKKEYPTAPI